MTDSSHLWSPGDQLSPTRSDLASCCRLSECRHSIYIPPLTDDVEQKSATSVKPPKIRIRPRRLTSLTSNSPVSTLSPISQDEATSAPSVSSDSSSDHVTKSKTVKDSRYIPYTKRVFASQPADPLHIQLWVLNDKKPPRTGPSPSEIEQFFKEVDAAITSTPDSTTNEDAMDVELDGCNGNIEPIELGQPVAASRPGSTDHADSGTGCTIPQNPILQNEILDHYDEESNSISLDSVHVNGLSSANYYNEQQVFPDMTQGQCGWDGEQSFDSGFITVQLENILKSIEVSNISDFLKITEDCSDVQ